MKKYHWGDPHPLVGGAGVGEGEGGGGVGLEPQAVDASASK